MPLMGVDSPMQFAAVGVKEGATKGIRKTLADVPGPKDGAMFDNKDQHGIETVKECPECGGTYTGDDHKHVVRVGKSMGIREMLRLAKSHCDKCASDTLMKCATCGCHKPQDGHEEATMIGKENVGIRKALERPAPAATRLDGIRAFTKSLRSRIAQGPKPGQPVGYMVGRNHPGTNSPVIGGGHDVFCSSCSPRVPHRTPLYRENIGDYRQSCHGCGRTLVEGKTPMWPELFDKR